VEPEEWTVTGLQARMARGELSATELVAHYLARIEAVDRAGPALRAVIEINEEAPAIAAALDAERSARGPRGPLHGIPVIVKDNIDTGDKMVTSAGSLALAGHRAARDATVVRRLREAGAVLLGKANLSEWAYFRSTRGVSGWSSRGGQTRNPYALDRSPSGSSSGSAVAVAADLAPLAVGTETDGSIVAPASANGVVGFKPTVGLVSRSGIVPISHSQDTAGPLARSVEGAALLLDAIAGADPDDPVTAQADLPAGGYAAALRPDALVGARLGVARDCFGRHEGADAVAEAAIEALRAQGAEIVDHVEVGAAGLAAAPELELLLYEFKHGLDTYLAGHPGAGVGSLDELIAFNLAHAESVMPYFRQELLEMALAKGSLADEAYRRAKELCLRAARDDGIDRALRDHRLDALLAPTSAPAWVIDPIAGDRILGVCASPAAVAGYPHVSVPAGEVRGLPVGLSLFAGRFSDSRLLAYAAAFERAVGARRPPTYPASVT
jgi:amidase